MDVDGLAKLWGGGSPALSPASQQPAAVVNDTGDAHPLIIRAGGPGTAPQSQFGTLDGAKAALQGDANAQGGDDAAAIGRGIVNGIPIAGPYMTAGLNRVAAAARALTKDEPYSQALGEVQRFGQQTAANNPGATAVGSVLGNVAAFGPLAGTEAGATMMGMGDGSLLARAALGAGTNATVGGTDAYLRSGGEPDATRTGLAIGATFGSLGPAVGSLAGIAANGARDVVNGFRPSTAADSALAASLRDTSGDFDAMRQRLAANPSLSLTDVNPGALTLAQGLSAQAGPARSTLAQFSAFEMFVNFVSSLVPILPSAARMTQLIRPAIKPYSMAVAPESSRMKRRSVSIAQPV